MTALVDIHWASDEDSIEEFENMTKNDDQSVAGWAEMERRKEERRAQVGHPPRAERRGPDRRRSQNCFHCGKLFEPTPLHKFICPDCRANALRKGGI